MFPFSLGWPEVVIIGVVALVIFGPKKIPELGGAIGRTLRGFKEEIGGNREPEDDDSDTNI